MASSLRRSSALLPHGWSAVSSRFRPTLPARQAHLGPTTSWTCRNRKQSCHAGRPSVRSPYRPASTGGAFTSASHSSRQLHLSAATRPQAQQSVALPDPPTTETATSSPIPEIKDLTEGFSDGPLILEEGNRQVDWARSFHGLSSEPFSKEAAKILTESISPEDVEVKPDGIIYLPEIKYRRILNRAFGPGGWGMAPRGETMVTGKSVTREYALVAHGRLVSVARGEQDYFSPEGISTAAEGCKSNALRRCCKDLGVASELWDPRFIRTFKGQHAREVFVEHVPSKKRRKMWFRKDQPIAYPYKESKGFGA